MNYSDYRKKRQTSFQARVVERRPALTTQEQRFLYSLRLKTMEYRTLMATFKHMLPPSQVDAILVEYGMRLRKAKKNFELNNYDYTWGSEEVE